MFHLRYINSREIITSRFIEPFKTNATIDCFEAFCHLENTRRSFWFERIEQVAIADTGEIISVLEFFYLVHPNRKVTDDRRNAIQLD